MVGLELVHILQHNRQVGLADLWYKDKKRVSMCGCHPEIQWTIQCKPKLNPANL